MQSISNAAQHRLDSNANTKSDKMIQSTSGSTILFVVILPLLYYKVICIKSMVAPSVDSEEMMMAATSLKHSFCCDGKVLPSTFWVLSGNV